MNYSDNNPTAVGLDYNIELLKLKLSELPFNGTVYGRCYLIEDDNGARVPAFMGTSTGDYKVLTPNDREPNTMFIIPTGASQIVDSYNPEHQNSMSCTVDIIMHGDTRDILGVDASHISSHLMASMVASKLREFPRFRIESITEQSERVYSMFDFDWNQMYYMYPYFCFKISGTLYYDDEDNKANVFSDLHITNGFGQNNLKTYSECPSQ